jgi:hypothetical protein
LGGVIFFFFCIVAAAHNRLGPRRTWQSIAQRDIPCIHRSHWPSRGKGRGGRNARLTIGRQRRTPQTRDDRDLLLRVQRRPLAGRIELDAAAFSRRRRVSALRDAPVSPPLAPSARHARDAPPPAAAAPSAARASPRVSDRDHARSLLRRPSSLSAAMLSFQTRKARVAVNFCEWKLITTVSQRLFTILLLPAFETPTVVR